MAACRRSATAQVMSSPNSRSAGRRLLSGDVPNGGQLSADVVRQRCGFVICKNTPHPYFSSVYVSILNNEMKGHGRGEWAGVDSVLRRPHRASGRVTVLLSPGETTVHLLPAACTA